MLIIFDLDDTLINTSASLVPKKLHDALTKMFDSGLHLSSNVEESFQQLLTINNNSTSGRETIQLFCDNLNQSEFAKVGIEEYYQNIDARKVKITKIKYCQELLDQLEEDGHTLALVSHGIKEIQLQKIDQAMIDPNQFKKIYITDKNNKGLYYQKLLLQLNFTASNTVVIGDNLQRDILPAKKLGVSTIHFKSGRAKNTKYSIDNKPSFFINSLNEVFAIVDKLSS